MALLAVGDDLGNTSRQTKGCTNQGHNRLHLHSKKRKKTYRSGEEINEARECNEQKGIAHEHSSADFWIRGIAKVEIRDNPHR